VMIPFAQYPQQHLLFASLMTAFLTEITWDLSEV
jgi:hypothetical protein